MRLSVITCTLNLDLLLQSKLFEVFSATFQKYGNILTPLLVVNQAVPAKVAGDSPLLHLFEQKNYGGAGGFTRGIIEAMNLGATHFLLMDDDAIPDDDAFSIVINHYLDEANQKHALHGTMFLKDKRDTIYEAGAWIERPFEKTFNSISRLRNHKVTTQNVIDDPALHENLEIDYGAWWFFACPISVVNKVGLPLPLFIHGDDREYGLRLKMAGIPTIPLPGLRVFHPEHGGNLKEWYLFFYWRNVLIEKAIYTKKATFSLLVALIKRWFYRIIAFQYDTVDYMLEGIESYLQGPDAIKKSPEHDIFKAKSIEDKWPITYIDRDSLSRKQEIISEKIKPNNVQEIKWAFFLNGLLFPKSKNDEFPVFTPSAFKWISIRRHRQYGICSLNNDKIKLYELKFSKLLSLLRRSVTIFLKFLLKNHFVQKQWNGEFAFLSNKSFWDEYLKSESN
jgi:galactofuranosylgalactofuranosylrhamnosyl-N-acetylglucosaminyl-diphospho-decaprenol beta-1,5/1,6-galactofuranosyltransferase